MAWIPSHVRVIDVSTLFVTRVPQFLSDLEKDPTLALLVKKNDLNKDFLDKIHPTDDTFYFYKDKYMSLPLDYTDDELIKTGVHFFQ